MFEIQNKISIERKCWMKIYSKFTSKSMKKNNWIPLDPIKWNPFKCLQKMLINVILWTIIMKFSWIIKIMRHIIFLAPLSLAIELIFLILMIIFCSLICLTLEKTGHFFCTQKQMHHIKKYYKESYGIVVIFSLILIFFLSFIFFHVRSWTFALQKYSFKLIEFEKCVRFTNGT